MDALDADPRPDILQQLCSATWGIETATVISRRKYHYKSKQIQIVIIVKNASLRRVRISKDAEQDKQMKMAAWSETSPEVTDEWILPHRVCDTHIGQNLRPITPRALARPLLQLHQPRVRYSTGFSDYSVIVGIHPQEIDHGKSKLNDRVE